MKWLVILISLVACTPKDDAPKAPLAVSVEVTDDGYKPARIDAERNQKVTLTFTRTTESTCGEELVVPSQNVKVRLPLRTPVDVTVVTSDSGTIAFACGMDMLHGAIVVR